MDNIIITALHKLLFPASFAGALHPIYSSFHIQSYFGIVLYLFLAMALCGLLAAAAYLFSLSSAQDAEKRSEYECGFEPFDSATRLPFDVHFYLVGILFLIFDVEISLLFPWVLSLKTSGWFGFYLMVGFIVLLAVGFLYEWKRGALIWPSRQQELAYVPSSEKDITVFLVLVLFFPVLFASDYYWLCLLFISAQSKAAYMETKGCSALATPTDNTNQLRVLSQLPRLARKARFSARLNKLNRVITSWRFKTVRDYISLVRLTERRLRFFKANINFYIRKTAQLASLCRSKNPTISSVVSRAEQNVLAELGAPVKLYSAITNQYKTLYKKLSTDPILKKQNARSPVQKKLTASVRKYLYLRSYPMKSRKVMRNALKRLRKSIQLLANIGKPRVNQLRKNNKLPANNGKGLTNHHVSKYRAQFFSFPLIPTSFSPLTQYFNELDFSSVYSTADQFFIGFLPEALLTLVITVVLAFLAVELGAGRLKKELTFESSHALQLGLLYAAAIYALQLFGGALPFVTFFSGYAWTNEYVSLIKLLVIGTGYFILWHSTAYIRTHAYHLVEYPLTLTLATLFLTLLVTSSHLVSAFVSIVGFSLNLYVLVLFDATTAVAREAGIKYFYLSALSSGLMLYGSFLIILTAGTGSFSEIAQVLSTDTELPRIAGNLLHLGIVFLLIGLFFKLSAFPGHLWAAEVYEGSPDPITGFFMLPVKIAVLGFVIHLLSVTLGSVALMWQPIVMVSAALSMVWGCFAALAEPKTKRFLAYTSINQMGFLLLGLATASFEGYRSTLVYLVIYIVMNIGFLTVFLNARRKNENVGYTYLTDFRYLGQTDAATSFGLAMILFSMAGIPPLAGFFGKYYLLLHAQEQGLYGLVIIGLVTSLVSAYYYLRVIKIMWFEGSEGAPLTTYYTTPVQTGALAVSVGFLFIFLLCGSFFATSLGNILEVTAGSGLLAVIFTPSNLSKKVFSRVFLFLITFGLAIG